MNNHLLRVVFVRKWLTGGLLLQVFIPQRDFWHIQPKTLLAMINLRIEIINLVIDVRKT
jgi:hypothetical protein